MNSSASPLGTIIPLTRTGRLLVLFCAFLGWMCSGLHMQITQLASKSISVDLLGKSGELDSARFIALDKQANPDPGTAAEPLSSADAAQLKAWNAVIQQWFAWHQCAFLFGAASGGLLFGWLGDRIGRAKGMALSILTFSSIDSMAYFAQTPLQFWTLWFLGSLGVGGMWPNGVALLGEAWAGISRPMVAGILGTAANIGIFLMATLGKTWEITPADWRWTMLVAAAPIVLGIFSLLTVPESPRWLASRLQHADVSAARVSIGEVLRPPLLGTTLLGIALATIPLIGGWGSANWMIPWADGTGDPTLKAQVGQYRSATGIVGSLIGGWVASIAGRRLTYFLVSLFAVGIAQYTFWFLTPKDSQFLLWVAGLGFFSGIYFGWLPLFLPELFSTRVRSAGAGVSFNFGRIATAVTLFLTGALKDVFQGDYARIGQVTSLIYLLGMFVVCFIPDTSRRQLED